MQIIGVLIILVGFVFRLDTFAVVIVSGLVTCLLNGMSFLETLNLFGQKFIDNRFISVFFLTLPIIGVCERFGLKEYAGNVIKGMKKASLLRILFSYCFARTMSSALSLRISGHPQFVRPIVYPMLEAYALDKFPNIDEDGRDLLKGMASAIENYGNFFGQTVFVGSSGVLLVIGVMQSIKVEILPSSIAIMAVLPMITSLVISYVQLKTFEHKMNDLAKTKGWVA